MTELPTHDNHAYRQRRKNMGLTQKQLADFLGVGRDTIIARETGKSRLITEHWLALTAIQVEIARIEGIGT
jgi:DNA-binding XRE family transcriptional regulator